MNVVSWGINKTRFSKKFSPQIGENQNCPTWVRTPLQADFIIITYYAWTIVSIAFLIFIHNKM